MTTEQIGYFLKLAENLNYTATAKSFFITQPTLSRQISNLEAELQVLLFFRERNKVELTEAGRLLYRRLKPIFLDLMDVMQEIANYVAKDTLMIGIEEEQIASTPLLIAINMIQHKYPALKITIHHKQAVNLIEDFENGKYDIINVLSAPEIQPHMPAAFLLLEQEPTYMAIAGRLEPGIKDQITIDEFKDYMKKYRLILPEMLTHHPEAVPINSLSENMGIPFREIEIVQSGSPLALGTHVSAELGISLCNKTAIIASDSMIKTIQIIGAKDYKKGIYFRKQMENIYLIELIRNIKNIISS